MKNIKLIMLSLIIGLVSQFSSGQGWTGKYKLSPHPTEANSFLVQVVVDNDGKGYLSGDSAIYLITDDALGITDYTFTNILGSWTPFWASDGLSFPDEFCGTFLQLTIGGPVGQNNPPTYTAGTVIDLVKITYTGNAECPFGTGVRLFEFIRFLNETDACQAYEESGGTQALGVNSNSEALTGVLTTSVNPLICEPDPCLEIVEGGDWNQSFTKAQVTAMLPKTIIDSYAPITVPGTNAGMFFDVYRLDNSFDLKINGQHIVTSGTSHEMQFDIGTPAASMNNIRFLDGDLYSVDAQPIWKIIGSATKPAVRVEVSPEGKITLYGSKESNGQLYELRLYNGAVLNDVQWFDDAVNTIEVTQDAYGATRLKGKVYGENICSTGFYKITKTGSFDNTPPFNPGDLITYNIQVKNLGSENISNVVVVDPLLGGEITVLPSGDTNGVGILNVGELWTYTVTYPITADDIAKRGVYNLATVFGKDPYGNPIPTKKSFDPDGLQPGDPEYDPNCPTCTYTPITGDCNVIYPIDSTDPFYWAYNYSTYKGGQPDITNSGTIIGTNEGLEFDIYRLDNSFNMEINGVKLFNDELQFDAKLTPGVNIEFVGGGEYGKNGIARILSLRGDQDNPLIKVKVSATGVVQLFGSKTSYGAPVELKPKVGSFNTISWYTDPLLINNITVSQQVWWKTVFEGYGYGVQINCNPDRPGGDQPVSLIDDNKSTVKYYPNPVNTTLHVQANTAIQEIEMYNVLGQRVINLRPNRNETDINVENLQADVYIMKLTLNGKVETYRVIKE